MKLQNQIKRTLSKPEVIEYIRQLLEERDFASRSELADFLCGQLGFQDPRGQRQMGGCLKALRELEAKGKFQLPPPRVENGEKGGPRPRRLAEPVAEPQAVPGEVGEIGGLELILVEQESQMRIWNELMIREHPQGAGPLVGRQIRYLVGSAHGWLGAFGFAAPALQLEERDRWIGWTAEQRRALAWGGVPEPFSDSAQRGLPQFGLAVAEPELGAAGGGLRTALPLSSVAGGKFRRHVSVFRGLLSGRELDAGRSNQGTRAARSFHPAGENHQGHLCLSAGRAFPRALGFAQGRRAGTTGSRRWPGGRELGETGVWWGTLR